jgi:cold shock CspA family protein
MKGIVKWFSAEKGFGFIVDDADNEYYFHGRDIKGASLPRSGAVVTFVPAENKKGVRATQVALVAYAGSVTGAESERNGSRVTCRACNRLMVPRVITGPPLGATRHWTPVPKRSICPHCASTYREFAPSDTEYMVATIQWIVAAVIILILLGSFLRHW